MFKIIVKRSRKVQCSSEKKYVRRRWKSIEYVEKVSKIVVNQELLRFIKIATCIGIRWDKFR